MSEHSKDRAIDYVEFAVPDIPAVKKFYGDAFGWIFEDWGDGYCAFKDGRLDGGFRKVDPVQSGGGGAGRSEGGIGEGALVILYASDLAAAEEAVKRAGGRIVEHHEFPGGRRFHFADPAGNVLAVWSEA